MIDERDNLMVRTRGLRKDYGSGESLVRAVYEVDLDVRCGETLAVMGPSGCGKSTLLHLLGGLDRPTGGELWVNGRRIDGLSERSSAQLRTIALVLLALVNAVLVTWATVQDTRHASAIERALGASPAEVGWALVVAQLVPALPGALLGVPVGLVLYDAVGRHSSKIPSAPALLGVLIVTLLVVAMLTSIPARIGARKSVAEILQAELA
jgi:energy-coupling factor transporter ATP-binding protein EcfA2